MSDKEEVVIEGPGTVTVTASLNYVSPGKGKAQADETCECLCHSSPPQLLHRTKCACEKE